MSASASLPPSGGAEDEFADGEMDWDEIRTLADAAQ